MLVLDRPAQEILMPEYPFAAIEDGLNIDIVRVSFERKEPKPSKPCLERIRCSLLGARGCRSPEATSFA